MTAQLSIRAYKAADEETVTNLWNEAFPDSPPRNDPATDIRRKRAVQPELFLVGELDGQLVATAMAGYDGHRAWVYYVAVAKEYRRRDFGRAIMSEVERRLREFGAPKLNLQVRSSNAEVVAFYERLGYTIEDRVSMGKKLI